MARIDWIEQRLQAWAGWLTVGDGSGYPAVGVLHPDWSPPSPGTTPTLKAAAPSPARETHRAVRQLSARLQATLWVHYVLRGSMAEQAARLGCQPDTVHARVEAAHVQLKGVLQHPASGVDSGILV